MLHKTVIQYTPLMKGHTNNKKFLGMEVFIFSYKREFIRIKVLHTRITPYFTFVPLEVKLAYTLKFWNILSVSVLKRIRNFPIYTIILFTIYNKMIIILLLLIDVYEF